MNGIDLKSIELAWSPPKGLLRGAIQATMKWVIAWLAQEARSKAAHWSEDEGLSSNVDYDSWACGVEWALERLRTGPEQKRAPQAKPGEEAVVTMQATEEAP